MARSQMMWTNRTKFLILGLVVFGIGAVFLVQDMGIMSIVPFSLPSMTIDIAGIPFTLTLLIVVAGLALMGISRIFRY